MSALRDNWRIVVLVALILVSAVTLFVPGATAGGADEEAPTGNASADVEAAQDRSLTNLQYGIQLDGGARIRAPVVGVTADNVDVTFENEEAIEEALMERFGLDAIDVEARPEGGTVEVFTDNVSQGELAEALRDEGYDVSDDQVSEGVTEATRQEMVQVIDRKLRASALSGVSVREASTPTGDHYIVIESSGRDIEDLRSILDERGVVRVYAHYRADNGTVVSKQVLTQDQFETVGNTRQIEENRYGVSVSLDDESAGPFTRQMQRHGYDQSTICDYDRENPNASNGRCLVTELNGEVVFAARVTGGLGSSFADGSFENDPTMTMSAPDREQARNLELSLKAGQPLPAPLDFDDAQTSSFGPALGERFKINSLITGIIAVFAVSGAVFVRYRDPRVALPMVVTALSEVFLLLGFVAAIQFPLDLSHVAGFIAVIGTGVDDLIIIADEILQEEGVATGRVFQNRFRRAFWVIGAAAATTIVAMSPLTVLSLGDLSGFAVVTIVGVLIGVLVTRPAYGDILRHLVLSEEERTER